MVIGLDGCSPWFALTSNNRGTENSSVPVLRCYELAYWKQATVHLDYHVEVEGYYYSVPHTLVKKKLDIRYTQNTVECFYSNKRVASFFGP